MLAPNKKPAPENKNTELSARLNVAEAQRRLLREENQRLKALEQALQQAKSELAQKNERTVLLEEELRWLKAQYYGRSIQTSDLCEGNPDQQMLFNEADVTGFFLEYDTERAGGFEPLRFVPKGKVIVLGLVTSKKGALESKDAIKRRIDEAAKFVPLDQLALSTQCGFSSTVAGNKLTIEQQAAKLRLVVELAKDIWGEA